MAEKKIRGRTFRVNRPLVTESLMMQARLTKAAGPNFMQIMTSAMNALPAYFEAQSLAQDATEEEKAAAQIKMVVAGSDVVTAVSSIFERLSPQDYAQLAADLVAMAEVAGESGVYYRCEIDENFSEMDEVIIVIAFVLKEVFGNFIKGLLGNGAPGKKAKV